MKKKQKFLVILLSVAVLCIMVSVIYLAVNSPQISMLSDDLVYTEFQKQLEKETKNIPGLSEDNSIEMGIANQLGVCEQDQRVNLDSGETYERFVCLQQNIEKTGCYSLVVFDNFKQIPFCVDGIKMNQCTISLKYGEALNVPVSIDGLEDGVHRLVFVWLFNVNKNFSKKEISEYDYTDLTSALWTDVVVGEDTWNLDTVLYDRNFFDNCSTDINIMNQDGADDRWMGWLDAEKRGGKFYVTAGNNTDEKISKTVVWLMSDYEQVPIDQKGNYCLYAEIPQNKFISQPISYKKNTDVSHTYRAFSMDLDTGDIYCSDALYFNGKNKK